MTDSHPDAQQHLQLQLEYVPLTNLLLHDVQEHSVFIFRRHQLELLLDHAAGARFAGDDAVTTADTAVKVDRRFTIYKCSCLKLTAFDAGTAARA